MAIYKNTPPIITNGLILNLDAGNNKSYPGSGTAWTDLSGNSNTGTLTNGPTFSRDGGGSINFTTDDYVNLGTLSTLTGKTNVSVECWFYNNSTVSTFQSVVGQFDGTNGWLIHTSTITNYKLIVLVGDGSAYGGINDTPTGSWIHVVLAYDGTLTGNTNRLKMYVNGILRTFDAFQTGTVPASWPNVTTVNANMGALLPTYGRYFEGKIPICKIYQKTLTASEIQQNYNALKSRFNLN